MSAPQAQTRSSEQRVLDRLHEVTGRAPTPAGGQHKAICPAHDDATPSLAVSWKNGAVGVYCHAGCTVEQVVDALGLQMGDLWDEPLPDRDHDHGHDRPRKRTASRTRRTTKNTGSLAAANEPAWKSLPLERQPDTVPKSAKHDKGDPVGPWRATTWHLYTSPGSEEITWAVIRLQQDREHGYDKEFLAVHREPGRTGGRYRTQDGKWHSLPAGWVTKRPAVEHQDLYRAPAVRAAKAAGLTGPVYLPEGESDADAVAALGELAVTEGAATAKWPEQCVELLEGMDVVLVLDRDDEGIRRGERVARLLAGRVRSLRVVQPIGEGNKDIRDHLAAGHTLDELREVDLAIPGIGTQIAPVTELHPATPNTARDDDEAPNELPHEYLVRRGELVERVWRDGVPSYKTVLGCVAWVAAVTEEDNGTEETRYQRPTRDVRFVIQRHGPDGDLVEQRDVRIDAEKIAKGTWHQEWPYPDTIIARGRRALDKTLDAIHAAVPSPTRRTPVYTATGWRRTDTGWIYIHGGGAIGRGGALNGLDVDIDGVLARTALPEPATNPDELRRAWLSGAAPLMQLPGRIGGPLSGFVTRSIIGGPQQMVLHLHGPRGTMKTAATRLFLQHVVPGLRYPRVKEMASGASGLSSVKGMQRLLGAAKDVPMEIDDLAPDRGGAAEAQTRLAELARQVYNASGQLKADRQPGRMVMELPPRCSLITTGEVTAGGSAETRCFNILVEPGALSVDLIAELERPDRCDARALLGASFIRWCAEHYDDLVRWVDEITGILGAAWRTSLRDLPHDDGVIGRLAEAATGCTVGIALEAAFLTNMGAISHDEAQQKWDWAITGIREAARELEADASDPAVRLVGWTQEALATKSAHLTGPGGGPPKLPDDEMAPARYGWTPQYRTSSFDTETTITWQPNGPMIGTLPAHRPDRVYLVPDATIEAAKRVATRTETRWAESKVGFSSALHARGWIATTREAGRTVRCPNREIDGGSRRVWDLTRSVLDGHFGSGGNSGDDPTTPGPQPLDPRLATVPGLGEIPTLAQTPAHTPSPTPAAATTPDSDIAGSAPRTAPPHAEPDAPSEETMPPTQTQPAPTSKRRFNDGQDWAYPVMVADIDAAYLPDDTVMRLDDDHLNNLADVAELADALGIGHHAATGQVWLTKRLTDRMGLIITDADPLPDPDADPKKFNQAVGALLTERGAELIAATEAAGWKIGDDTANNDTPAQIRPRLRLHRADGRVLTLVLAHYATLWDPRRTGPDHHEHPLPEPDEDPVGYGLELARRAARLSDLLGEPWASSAGQMGALLYDRIRARSRNPVTTAGPVPDLGDLRGQNSLETTWAWWRRFKPASLDELLRTPYVHRFDGRASWLLCAGTLNLGFGEPQHYTGADAQSAADQKTLPFGLWLVTLPSWGHATLMPPHPAISRDADADPTTCWVTTPSLRLLHAADHLDLGVHVHEAWIWPQQGRKLSSWYETLRDALQAARRHEDGARRLLTTTATDDAIVEAQREAATWSAVAESIKSIYAGYIGRMISPATKHNKARPWHHQPVWRDAIVAEARRRDYMKLHAHFEATGHAPVAAIGTDEYWFLSDSPDPASVAPDEDNGKLGKLRPKGEAMHLTEDLARKICGVDVPGGAGTPLHMALGGRP